MFKKLLLEIDFHNLEVKLIRVFIKRTVVATSSIVVSEDKLAIAENVLLSKLIFAKLFRTEVHLLFLDIRFFEFI